MSASALFEAIKNQNFQLAECLLQNGNPVNVNLQFNSTYRMTPLIYAILIKSHICIIERLLVHGANVNLRDDCNCLALHYAIHTNHIDALKLLIECGADVNARCPNSKTPLHLAIDYNSIECARVLLENGAEVNALDSLGHTPLFLSVETNNNIQMLELLLSYGADSLQP